jgi:hypothetical protein
MSYLSYIYDLACVQNVAQLLKRDNMLHFLHFPKLSTSLHSA